MSTKTADAIIVLVTVAIGVYGLVLRPSAGVDRYRYVGAVGLVFVGLSLLADISPEIAGPFALLLGLAVYARYLQQRKTPSLSPKQASQATGGGQRAGASLFGQLPSF